MENTGRSAGDPTEKAPTEPPGNADESEPSEDDGSLRNYAQDDPDAFSSQFLSRHGGPGGLAGALRAMSGFMPGVSGRLRDIMNRLKAREDPSLQLIALQELSEVLLVSTEENLQGHFSPDQCVKELVTLMQPGDSGGGNSEMMLLACRCLANLMEALPASTANVVYGGAVPVLCQKLLEIEYIDLAEQALSVSHHHFLDDLELPRSGLLTKDRPSKRYPSSFHRPLFVKEDSRPASPISTFFPQALSVLQSPQPPTAAERFRMIRSPSFEM